MENCIFCKIITGLIPCYKVYEDNYYLGFLDIKPLSTGNSLLIPKDHYRWVYDVPNFGEYFEIARKIAMVTKSVVKAEAISFLTLGYEIPHAHIRIIPRFTNDLQKNGIDTRLTINQSSDNMKILANDLFSRLSLGQP